MKKQLIMTCRCKHVKKEHEFDMELKAYYGCKRCECDFYEQAEYTQEIEIAYDDED